MDVEAVLLTGGASRRMGEDKASLLIGGVPQARRIAEALANAGLAVTVLGREPLDGYDFVQDEELYAGPVAALSRFTPTKPYVFVCSCDLPRFDAGLVGLLRGRIGDAGAAAPKVNGWRQPLCALYAREAWDTVATVLASEDTCAMRWLESTRYVVLEEDEITAAGIDPQAAQGANTKKELTDLLP